MTAGIYNIDMKQGDDFTLVASSWTDSSGNLISLVGYTAQFQARNNPSDSTKLIDLTSSSGITISTGAGTISIALTAAQTALLTFKEAIYDLQMTSSGGTVTTLLSGKITLIPDVTR